MELENKELKALTVIFRASQAIQEVIRKDVASYDLNTTEFAVLELLYHKGDQPIQTVGKKILIASSSITYVIDKLEKKQLVSRRDCPNDRRVIYATLTSKGNELMDQIFPLHQEKVASIFGCLEENELDNIIELMKKIGYQAEKI
ncbi:MarR family winged helix-turn-helix transcriptional regulator [Rummeliibacillus pycnus]|uniref:MarR family winged helix-turn-helix transcriptional regulator n=1 Tax=Rummeliibacillus pycnus TaxID=101070 RepID=UPI0037C6E1DC